MEEASQTVELNKLLGVSFGEDKEEIKRKVILLEATEARGKLVALIMLFVGGSLFVFSYDYC